MSKASQEKRNHWEKYIPELVGEYTHWWLEGDGGLLIVTNDLTELLDVIEANHGKLLIMYVYRAYINDEGDAVMNHKFRALVSDYAEDKITKRFREPDDA